MIHPMQMLADVPVGVPVGGIDSSTVVLMQAEARVPVNIQHLFQRSGIIKLRRAVAKRLGTNMRDWRAQILSDAGRSKFSITAPPAIRTADGPRNIKISLPEPSGVSAMVFPFDITACSGAVGSAAGRRDRIRCGE